MATDYGTDFSLLDDLDANLSVISGPRVVVEAVMRRLETPRGGLWYDREYGTDLRQFVNGSAPRTRVAQAVELEALKDERVNAADAEVSFDDRTLRVVLRLTLADGVFALTISVSALTVELINFAQAA